MDKQFMLFSKRKELAEEYEKWVNTPLEDGRKIKDCTLSVITFMQTKGYRKIPDGAVVLIDKKDIQQYEWSKLVDKMGVIEFGEKICKETAEKFARLVEFHSVSTRDEEGREIFTISALGLKEILHEEFGIPYDEIAKELTEGRKWRDT